MTKSRGVSVARTLVTTVETMLTRFVLISQEQVEMHVERRHHERERQGVVSILQAVLARTIRMMLTFLRIFAKGMGEFEW